MIHENVEQFKGWIRTTWIPYLDRIPEKKREKFINQLTHDYRLETGQLDKARVSTDMVRLEYSARKPG